jgi:hypothetical protein
VQVCLTPLHRPIRARMERYPRSSCESLSCCDCHPSLFRFWWTRRRSRNDTVMGCSWYVTKLRSWRRIGIFRYESGVDVAGALLLWWDILGTRWEGFEAEACITARFRQGRSMSRVCAWPTERYPTSERVVLRAYMKVVVCPRLLHLLHSSQSFSCSQR